MNKLVEKEMAEIAKKYNITYSTIQEFRDKVNWIAISWRHQLSEDFIREFQDKVAWDNISSSQKLSEKFIADFQDKVCWHNIAYCQNFSEDFVKKFYYKLNPVSVILPDSSRQRHFMTDNRLDIDTRIVLRNDKKTYVVVEFSEDRIDVWVEQDEE